MKFIKKLIKLIIKLILILPILFVVFFYKTKRNDKSKSEHLVFILHAFFEYNELNGTTDLTRDIFLHFYKKKNFIYPFLFKKKKVNFLIEKFHHFIKEDINLAHKLFPSYKKNYLKFNSHLQKLKSDITSEYQIKDKNNDVEKFLNSRSHSELFFGDENKNILFFHHTSPIASGIFPWSIFVENVFTLFHPFLIQSKMQDIDLRNKFFYYLIKKHLEHDNCKEILVNYKQTKVDISEIFRSEIINKKIKFFKQGTKSILKYNKREFFIKKNKFFKRKVKFLFVNSFNGQDINFFCRGGEYAINTFIELNKKYSNIELTIRSPLPKYLKNKVGNYNNVNVIDKWISKEDYVKLYKNSHFLFSAGIGGYTETNLHCLMNGVILIGPDDFINNEKFEERFIKIKSINKEITESDKILKNFRYQKNDKLFNYNSVIHNDTIREVDNFMHNKKGEFLEYINENYEHYLKNFKFEDMIQDVEKKIFRK